MNSKPCSTCPFRKTVEPGATGGSDPTVFIGQAFGPFFLPCHSSPGYEEGRRSTKHIQCAGAAIFRANCKVDKLMPKQLLSLPPDRELVFYGPHDFLAHHLQSEIKAWLILSITPPTTLLQMELSKNGVQFLEAAK